MFFHRTLIRKLEGRKAKSAVHLELRDSFGIGHLNFKKLSKILTRPKDRRLTFVDPARLIER